MTFRLDETPDDHDAEIRAYIADMERLREATRVDTVGLKEIVRQIVHEILGIHDGAH